jgi:hypothetical protein
MAFTHACQSQVSERYVYQPLDFKKHQIRLLQLRANSEYASDYQLKIFDYKSAPPYVAISYTWGPEKPTAFITIDGKSFEIRLNLLNFLNAYKEDVYLWVDQICIDQSNYKERTHQVGLMSMVYARCDHVLVWLSNDSTHVPSTYQAALDFNKGVESYPEHDTRSGSSDSEQLPSSPILALMRNPYFERLWIVQELLLNKNIRILVEGNVSISWMSLSKKHHELSNEITKIIPSTSWMVEAQRSRFTFAGHSPKHLAYYLTTTAGKYYKQKCENPRDKVYGFMALVAPTSKVTVDYSKSVQAVYLDAFWVMLMEYWDMIHDIPESGYELFRIRWEFEMSKSATWDLAQAMGITHLEPCGLKSFIDSVWERIRQYEVTVRLAGRLMNTKTHCINLVGYEPENDESFNGSDSRSEPTTAVSERWWYEFNGQKYYYDCKE